MKTEVIKFGATWCAGCMKMATAFHYLAKEMESETISFKDVDVETDEGVELSSLYQVRNIPTILIIKKGRVIERITGTRTKEELKEIIEKWK